MKQFDSLAALAAHLGASAQAEVLELQHGLELSASLIEKTAKEEIGVYQDAVDPFAAWAPLAEATVADRVRQGFSPDDPLLRTGRLRDSIVHEVEDLTATIGSTDEIGAYQELGTKSIPPRPFLGTALYRNLGEVQRLIGNAAVAGFVGGDPINPSEGYTIEGSAE